MNDNSEPKCETCRGPKCSALHGPSAIHEYMGHDFKAVSNRTQATFDAVQWLRSQVAENLPQTAVYGLIANELACLRAENENLRRQIETANETLGRYRRG